MGSMGFMGSANPMILMLPITHITPNQTSNQTDHLFPFLDSSTPSDSCDQDSFARLRHFPIIPTLIGTGKRNPGRITLLTVCIGKY